MSLRRHTQRPIQESKENKDGQQKLQSQEKTFLLSLQQHLKLLQNYDKRAVLMLMLR